MKIVHPATLLGKKIPRIGAHHGTCDLCKKRLVYVLHLNEDREPRGFRICEDCSNEVIGWLTVFKEVNKDV